MIIDTSILGNIGWDFRLESRISEAERIHARKTLKRLAREKLQNGGDTVLKEVYEQLTYRGVSEKAMGHKTSDKRDSLSITFGDETFIFNQTLFRKNKRRSDISFHVKNTKIEYTIPASSTPESIADFISAVLGYMPEYMSVKETVIVEEEQRKIARQLGVDLLKKNICSILTSKGYMNDLLWSEHNDDAQIRVAISKGFSIKLDINLSELFFEDVARFVESLPEMPETKEFSLIELKNIRFCTVIRNYDDALLQHISGGGYNAIINDTELWVPNMSWSKAGVDKDYDIKVYRKKHILPGNAPVKRLRAVNDKLEEFMKGYDEDQRKKFLDQLITGVGSAAHCNRHACKMPASILEMEEND